MNQIFRTLLKAQCVIEKGRSSTKNLKNFSTIPTYQQKTSLPCYLLCVEAQTQWAKTLFVSYRTYSKNNKNSDPQAIVISKTISQRKLKKKKFREAIEDKQRKFQKDVENAFVERRILLNNTKKRIQEKGKLIIKDIKETKEKMKERIEEVIEFECFAASLGVFLPDLHLSSSPDFSLWRNVWQEDTNGRPLTVKIWKSKENIYTVPNLLCITRIVLSPLLAYLILSKQYEYALSFMIVAGISDWIDGWIARNYESQSSKLGSFLDPMSDKVLIGTLFLSLTYVDLIPGPLTVLIIGRDVILIISGFVIRYQSLPPPRTLSRYFDVTHATAQLAPTFISKVNTGIQLVLAATTLFAPVFGYVNHQFLQILWYVTGASTVASACSYIFTKETYKYLKKQKKDQNK